MIKVVKKIFMERERKRERERERERESERLNFATPLNFFVLNQI